MHAEILKCPSVTQSADSLFFNMEHSLYLIFMIHCLILKSQITSFFFCLYIFKIENSKETEHVDTQTYVKIK